MVYRISVSIVGTCGKGQDQLMYGIPGRLRHSRQYRAAAEGNGCVRLGSVIPDTLHPS